MHDIIYKSTIGTGGFIATNEVVSYRSDAIIQEFATEEEMLAAHKLQFPEEYET
jgi:hypothetical protein